MTAKWTREQEQAIRLRGRNILVSAAAGSGKTAVLVERILSRIADPEHPVDIDRLLVVTFTRAAAGEMKERIGQALEKRLLEDPDNEHLQRQGALLHHARISTIHGFCTYVIQNYFHRLDLDPGYRIADNGELKLLKTDVLKDILEEEYASGNQKFLDFSEACAPGKNDGRMEELILKTAEFAESYPWPEMWLEECEKNYRADSPEALGEAPFIRFLEEDAARRIRDARLEAEWNLSEAQAPGGPGEYIPMLQADAELLKELADIENYGAFYRAFQNLSFQTLSRKKNPDSDTEVKERIKRRRDAVKEALKELREQYFSRSPEEVLEELRGCRSFVEELVRLTRRYFQEYGERKRRKNLMEFSDLEHFALDILLVRDGEEVRRTDAARELAAQFEEVMVDEYQDSNYIQEYLLNAVSREEDGACNRFMVGDMKQAIYGFRMARPEIFLEKYQTYSKEESNRQRIDLSRNFRSRTEVLDTVNYLFRRIMVSALGGLDYDGDAALYPGAVYPENDACSSELLLLDRKSPEFEEDGSKAAMQEAEALAVAQKIRSLVGHMKVTDKQSGDLRPLRYRDCVILLRQTAGWADTFARILEEEGIPANATARSGYFQTVEVAAVLNYLRICDNPRQDIPFAAALHSPMGNVTDGELAEIKSRNPEKPIYEAAENYAEQGEDKTLRQKLTEFLKRLHRMRDILPYTPVHQVILEVLEETGYGACAAAMPGGEQRQANLNMLVKKAVDFENTSYHGLFQFIRYMEQLERYQVDFGEVSLYGELADTVRIMTIHKSKGLEFPVVFVCGMGGRMNVTDANVSVLLHASLGIGTEWIRLQERTRSTTLAKQVIRRAIRRDMLGEELRVLYVALTRAKEKLILTGTVDDLNRKMEQIAEQIRDPEGRLSYRLLSGAKCYWDWVLPALKEHPALRPVQEAALGNAVCIERAAPSPHVEGESAPIRAEVLTPAGMTLKELGQGVAREIWKEELRNGSALPEENREIRKFLNERDAFRYAFEQQKGIPTALTVSELKRGGMAGLQEMEVRELYPQTDVVPYIPEFMKEEQGEPVGAARGTIYHRVLECIDLEQEITKESLKNQISVMVKSRKLTARDAGTVKVRQLLQFAASSIGRRMQAAARRGVLKREQPFVVGVPASEVGDGWPDEEMILVQGIIDAYFEENGKLVLVDYKTDRAASADGREIAQKYSRQLQLYAKALEQISGKKVGERIIYSLSLGREILV